MLNIFKIFSLSFLAIILVGCNSNLLNQIDDQEQELAAEAEIEDEKTPEEVWEDLAEVITASTFCRILIPHWDCLRFYKSKITLPHVKPAPKLCIKIVSPFFILPS